MFETNPLFAVMSRALDAASLRQAVHTANIANADVDGFRRLEVTFNPQADLGSLGSSMASAAALEGPKIISTNDTVRLDQEMALMAKDAVRYQQLLNAFERTMGLLTLAARDGRSQ